jgi:hypothetical protein
MTARMIITARCNRSCPGCCNDSINYSGLPHIDDIKQLLVYDSLVITGGEPMLFPYLVHEIARKLRLLEWQGKIYLQTAYAPPELVYAYKRIVPLINGITFTLHEEFYEEDLKGYSFLGNLEGDNMTVRLNVDDRIPSKVYDKISVRDGVEIRPMSWKEDCPLPDNEVLVIWKGEV